MPRTRATTGTATTVTTGNATAGGTPADCAAAAAAAKAAADAAAAAAAATTIGAKEVPMAMVNPVLEAHAGMALFLEKVAKITHPILRYKVIINRFDDLDELAQMEPEHAARTCNVIRKSTGSLLTKDISTKQELVLKRLIQWAIFTYMVGRDLDLDDATAENLKKVGEYFKQVSVAKDPPEIPKFGDTSCKRKWMDAIKAHFALLKGSSGLPVGYVTREDNDGTDVEESLGKPSFDEQLLSSGRHDGFYYPMDNKLVYHTISI